MLLAAAVSLLLVGCCWLALARLVERTPDAAPRRVTWLGAPTAPIRVRRRMARRAGDPVGHHADEALADADEPWFC